MPSIYIGQLVWPATAPLIVHMRVRIAGMAIIYYYPHPAQGFHNTIDGIWPRWIGDAFPKSGSESGR